MATSSTTTNTPFTTTATLNGLFKVVYADKIQNLVPSFAVLQKRVDFAGDTQKVGNYFAQPVALASEQGFTYNGELGGYVALNDAVPGQMKEAQVRGSELILRGQVTYKSIAASIGSKAAFKSATAWLVEGLNSAMRKRLEIAMLYGQVGVATVGSIAATDLVTVSDATWAGGIWAGAENCYVDVVPSTLTGAHLVTNAKVTAINSDTKVLTITGATAGSVVAGNVIFFTGACVTGSPDTFNEMAGLQKILTNSSTLFNISAASYSLWKGNAVTSLGQPSHAKFQDAIARAVNKGLMDKVIILVSPKCFGVLNSDQAALRMFDSSYSSSKGDQGFESLMFHSTNGPCEIISHPLVKDGDAFMLPEDLLRRIGSVDLSFGLPGIDEFVQFIPGTNVYEIQCMADQAIFLQKPAHGVYVSGITYA